MLLHHIIHTIFIITGFIALLASILNWEWFFTSANAQMAVRHLGRTKSRCLYGAIGVLLIVATVYFYFHVKAAF